MAETHNTQHETQELLYAMEVMDNDKKLADYHVPPVSGLWLCVHTHATAYARAPTPPPGPRRRPGLAQGMRCTSHMQGVFKPQGAFQHHIPPRAAR